MHSWSAVRGSRGERMSRMPKLVICITTWCEKSADTYRTRRKLEIVWSEKVWTVLISSGWLWL